MSSGETNAPLWLRVARDTALLPGVVAGLIPWLLHRFTAAHATIELHGARWIGLAPLTLGLVGYASCTQHFAREGRGTPAPWDAPRELVAAGPYRWVRNPMYLAVLSCLSGTATLAENGALFAYTAVVAAIFHIRVVTFEEPLLSRRFGASFDSYCSSVRRWLPRPPRAS